MVSGSDKEGKGRPGDPADVPPVSDATDPLMNPAAALAAATAFGFGMAAQMSRFFLGSLQGAMDLTGELARQLEDERKAKEASTAAEKVMQPKAEAVTEEVTAAPAAPEPKTANAGPSKAQPKTVARPAAKAKVEASKPLAKAVAKTKAAKQPVAVIATKAVEPAETAAPAKMLKAAPVRKAGKADDLKRIDGIGPKLEQVLKGRGITRLQQLAEMEPEALEGLDRELGLDGRTLRDDWAGQARRLAGGKAATDK
ncbi:5' DNA nuclease [Rhizobium glycinendophyticum]|uniref:5' DNA nuclease n=1 Tax=Rhizobium glycinendophyticum TaxID=2589807 RepID=A0A504UIY4_9HYPH|nr:5' DNA nuclease [Rhizobium glycinendophyticum]TPP10715.1 5' DNA nuclease [Rhizobium glycinendophyticum]